MPEIAPSARRVPYSRIRELAELAMSRPDVLKLYFGESNLPTPEYIKRAAFKAMADGYTFYTENAGLLSGARRRSPPVYGPVACPTGQYPMTRLSQPFLCRLSWRSSTTVLEGSAAGTRMST